ncbi:MAG: geranylgeranylglyceryl/heptaprenylglyceryl phosphate synthase [Candidatus Njordarchaeia archaeon]
MSNVDSKVMRRFNEIIENDGIVHLTLLDPDPFKLNIDLLEKIAKALDECETDMFMVGGSTAADPHYVESVVGILKENSDKPIILFPGSVSGLAKNADAVFFLSPLNSRNWYFLIGAQMLAAPVIKKWNLEAVSLAYLIFEPGGTAAFVSDVAPIPRKKPEIAVAYAMAAELIGFDMIYLEAGSGAPEPIPSIAVKAVSSNVSKPVIVGGGIRTLEQAIKIVKAGASAIVQGSKFEEAILNGNLASYIKEFREFIKAVKKSTKGV